MTENFAELFEASCAHASSVRPGAIITAKVIDILRDVVVVDAQLKSEGFIPIHQFIDDGGGVEVKLGDEVEVSLDQMEDGYGETRLSRERAKRVRAWQALEAAYENGEIVHGTITDRVKGGFTVDVMHLSAFLPGSQVDIRPVRDVEELQSRLLDFKVIKIDRSRSNVVVSRRVVLENESKQEREEMLQKLDEGMEVKGIVKNLTDYGAFIDLHGVDGLLHITDMAWKRVKHPSEVVAIGDEIDVKILKFDRERNRVSLGLKQMGNDPWNNLLQRYPLGTQMSGVVTNLVAYGCFVEIESGVEGLVHVSEMDWVNKNILPSKVVTVGDEVEVQILGIDEERRRISLGMKQCRPNPWVSFSQKHAKGDKITGKVKTTTDFGVFIELESGIDGLIHRTDLSWSGNDGELMRGFSRGDEVESVILGIDAQRERISLGLKQLTEDTFSTYIAAHGKGSVVKGVVKSVQTKHAVLELAESVRAYLKVSEISLDEKVEDARRKLQEGDEIDVKIVSIDRKQHRINVSAKAYLQGEEKLATREYAPSAVSGAKLGDLLKEHLDQEPSQTQE